MLIDTLKTKKSLKSAGYELKGYAISRGFADRTFDDVISNRYPYPDSETAKAIKKQLKKDGFLFYEN